MVQIKWLLKRQLPEVLEIEQSVFGRRAWDENDFNRALNQRNCIGKVALDRSDRRIVGFLVFELYKSRYRVLNFAVAPEQQRCGVGTALFDHLKSRLSKRRGEIELMLRETNLEAQLFCRSQDFQAIEVIRDYYADSGESAYAMSYVLTEKVVA